MNKQNLFIWKRMPAYHCLLLVVFLLASCSGSDKGGELNGHWEMFVGEDLSLQSQPDGENNLSYIIKLNTAKRTFDSPDIPSGKSYGFMDFSNMRRIYHYEIDSISFLGNGRYAIVSVDTSWGRTQTDTLRYDAKTGELTYNNDWVFKPVSITDSEASSSEPSNLFSELSWVLVIVVIILMVVVYYLMKLILGYIFMTLGAAAIGAAFGGLILWGLIGGLDLELPRWLIITILAVPASATGIFGLISALQSSGEILNTPLASNVLKEMNKTPDKVVDQYGNESKVTDVQRGITGEKYIKTEDGKEYVSNGGNDATRIN